MKATQQNKLSMYITTKGVCDQPAHQPAWQSLPAFRNNYAQFTSLTGLISTLGAAQKTTATGVAANKAEITRLLIAETVLVAGQVAAFAAATGDIELEEKTSFRPYELEKLRDAEIDDRAQQILDLATARLVALADYGVTTDSLGVLDSAIDAYSAIVVAPRTATAKVKSITEAIVENFAKADRVLEGVLDRLVPVLAKTAPDFAREYEAARVIVDLPGTHAPEEPATPVAP